MESLRTRTDNPSTRNGLSLSFFSLEYIVLENYKAIDKTFLLGVRKFCQNIGRISYLKCLNGKCLKQNDLFLACFQSLLFRLILNKIIV